MNSIQRFFTKALASLMLAGLCFCFSTSVKAQCPPSAPDNPSIAWISGGCNHGVMLDPNNTGTPCRYTVCWCWRYISSIKYFDYVVSSVTKEDNICGTGVTTLNFNQVVTAATNWLAGADPKHNDYSVNIPPCGDGATLVTRMCTATCWSVTIDADGHGYVAICGSGGWCLFGTYYCIDSQGHLHSNGTFKSTIIGSCSSECNVISCPN